MSKYIVYYTCFFGKSSNGANIVPDKPSSTHDCIYFSNNDDTLKHAAEKGWIVVRDNTPVKETDRDNAVDAKELKACPHHFPLLKGYTYTCYLDSKLKIAEKDIHEFLGQLTGDVVMLLNPHPFLKPNVWEEYTEGMKQPRYAQNSEKYKNLIKRKVNDGFKNTAEYHYETSCILRKSGPIVDKIGEDWLHDIRDTGAECQIPFFFIQQKYKDNIRPLPRHYGRN